MSTNIDLSGVDSSELQRLLTPRLTKYIPGSPTPKQRAFLLMNDTKEILYGGAAGGGKSWAQLAAALQFIDVPNYSAILLRRTFADLAQPGALIDLSKQWLMPFVERKEVRWSEKEKVYTFPNNATLSFGYLESANDKFNYQGAEFQYIGIDECTQIDPGNYRYMFSRLRKKKEMQVPLRFRATTNPGGMFGEYYYQRFFVEGKENGRIFISAGLNDNPHLDAEQYREALNELDPVEREQLLNGNWEIKAAGDLLDRHWFQIVPQHEVPVMAARVRFWDLAGTDPSKRRGRNKREPDWTVGFKLACHQAMYWIEDIVRVQKKPHELEEIIKATAVADGYNCPIRMEQEPGSSGIITIDHYSRNVLPSYNFQGVVSTGSKVERARSASAAAQAGRVFVSDRCRNMLAFMDEADLFPYGAHDDTIDGFSGAFNFFRSHTLQRAPTSLKKAGGSVWRKFG